MDLRVVHKNRCEQVFSYILSVIYCQVIKHLIHYVLITKPCVCDLWAGINETSDKIICKLIRMNIYLFVKITG